MALMHLPELDRHDVVPADAADNLVDAVRSELRMLQAELICAESEATEAERRLAVAGPGASVADRAVREVEAAIAEVLKTANDELRFALDYAHARAATRIAEGELDAGAISALAQAERAWRLPPHVVPSPRPEPEPDVESARELASVPELEAAPEVEALPEVEAVLPVDVVLEADAPRPIEEAAPASRVDERQAEDSLTDAHHEFWAEESQRSKKRGFPIPIEAVLPMLALIVVLVVVLAWVG